MVQIGGGIVSFWKKQSKNWRIVVSRMVANRFLNNLAVEYNNIYVRELGATPIQLGEVNSFTHIASAILATPIGWLQDRYSLRRLYLIGVGLLTIAPLIYALAFDWVMIIPAIILASLAQREGSCAVICDTSLRNEDRATGKALCEGLGSSPSLVAPTIAAFIITFFGGISVESIRPLYWIQFVGRSIMFLYVFTQLTEIIRPKVKRSKGGFFKDLREVFDHGNALKRYIIFHATGVFLMGMQQPFRAPFAYEVKKAEPFILGFMVTVRILGQVLFSTPIGRLADKIGRKKIFFILAPIIYTSEIILVYAPTQECLVFSSILYSFFTISRIVVEAALMVELVPINYIGRWRGILGLIAGLAGVPAPIVGGILWETIGPASIFLIPILLDLLIRVPILATIPETLKIGESPI